MPILRKLESDASEVGLKHDLFGNVLQRSRFLKSCLCMARELVYMDAIAKCTSDTEEWY